MSCLELADDIEALAAGLMVAGIPTRGRVALMSRTGWVEGGEMTPTLELRRRLVTERYAQKVEQLYR